MDAKVGVEPSGEALNAISLDPVSGIPRNPMINAGAIATTAQIWQHNPEAAEATLLAFRSDLAGRLLHVDQSVYSSERDTGHSNRAINTIRRSDAGNHRRSRRWRETTEVGILEELGSRIRVVHAQGVLDFAATEQLQIRSGQRSQHRNEHTLPSSESGCSKCRLPARIFRRPKRQLQNR